MNKLELQTKISAVEDAINNYQIATEDYVEEYESYLDNVYEGVKIGKVRYHPSYILRNLYNVEFSLGLEEYVSSIEVIDDPSYQQLLLLLENLKDDLESI